MASLTLEQFRDIKLRGFPGWETVVTPGYEGATPYVEPVDARFGAPSHPFGTDPAGIGPAFERWCADKPRRRLLRHRSRRARRSGVLPAQE